MNTSTHPDEWLVDYVDGRLDAVRAADIRDHLEACATCRAVEAELRAAVVGGAVLRGDAIEMPADLVASVSRALDQASRPEVAAPVRIPAVIRGAVGLAAAALFAALFLQMGTPERARDLPTLAARDAGIVGSPSLPLAVSSADATVLERYFATTPGPRVRVIDLAMMQMTLDGAVRHTLAGRPSGLYSYRAPDGRRLVCQMFDGALADLPPPETVREENGFRFQIYTRGAVTLVFWQEGEIVCVLASDLPAADVIALAVAKAMAPA